MEFEAPDYSDEGVQAFMTDVINNEAYMVGCKNGTYPLYGAFEKGNLVGVMGLKNHNHIMLAFTKKEYHRKGIGTALFQYILKEIHDGSVTEITVNSSPYGVPFYLHLGFVSTAKEQVNHRIRYTPMKYKLYERLR